MIIYRSTSQNHTKHTRSKSRHFQREHQYHFTYEPQIHSVPDFFVICRKIETGNPEVFTATMKEIEKATHKHESEYWLEIEDYEKFERGITKLKSLKTF